MSEYPTLLIGEKIDRLYAVLKNEIKNRGVEADHPFFQHVSSDQYLLQSKRDIHLVKYAILSCRQAWEVTDGTPVEGADDCLGDLTIELEHEVCDH